MTYFLTSSPCMPDSPALNPANGFVEELQKALPGTRRALFICSDPDQPRRTYGFAYDMADSFEEAGILFDEVEVLERENQAQCEELVSGADLIFLVDGSYLLGKNGREELRGEAYRLENGVLTQFSREGGIVPL